MFGRGFIKKEPKSEQLEETPEQKENREDNLKWWISYMEENKNFFGNFKTNLDDQIMASWNKTFVSFVYHDTLDAATVPTNLDSIQFRKLCRESLEHIKKKRLEALSLKEKMLAKANHRGGSKCAQNAFKEEIESDGW